MYWATVYLWGGGLDGFVTQLFEQVLRAWTSANGFLAPFLEIIRGQVTGPVYGLELMLVLKGQSLVTLI